MVKGNGNKSQKEERLIKHTVTLSEKENKQMFKMMKPGEKVTEFIRKKIFKGV